MKDILENVKILCKQNDTTIEEIIKLYLAQKLDLDLENIDNLLKEDCDTLWDYQPSIDDNEELAFAIQHTRNIYDILIEQFY